MLGAVLPLGARVTVMYLEGGFESSGLIMICTNASFHWKCCDIYLTP